MRILHDLITVLTIFLSHHFGNFHFSTLISYPPKYPSLVAFYALRGVTDVVGGSYDEIGWLHHLAHPR